MTRTKLDTPAFADQSVDSRNIADGAVQNQDISGSITGTQLAGSIANDKLVNNKFTIQGKEVSLGGTITAGVLVDWQAITVADGSTTLTAEAGKGYFLDTNTGVIEVFLPSSPNRGDVIILADYSGTFATNQVIINTGGQLIDSTAGSEFKLTTNNTIAELVYVDSNKGWLVFLNQAAGTTPSSVLTDGVYDSVIDFTQATGGTVTTSGDYKIHTFTGDGTFCVAFAGNSPAFPGNPLAGPNTVSYLVVAGGGSAGGDRAGGGGAGGYREGRDITPSYTASPLVAPAGLTITPGSYPVSVGGGGAQPGAGDPNGQLGSNSVFSTITSAGGGHPRQSACSSVAGGSGGGGIVRYCGANSGGAGNTPPVSPPQGQPGGTGGGAPVYGAGGGGGAGGAGSNGSNSGPGGPGGPGVTTHISGSPVTLAGGGGGSVWINSGTGGSGGPGGGGAAGSTPSPNNGVSGQANTGGGGGGGSAFNCGAASAGGKGIVIIRYKFK